MALHTLVLKGPSIANPDLKRPSLRDRLFYLKSGYEQRDRATTLHGQSDLRRLKEPSKKHQPYPLPKPHHKLSGFIKGPCNLPGWPSECLIQTPWDLAIKAERLQDGRGRQRCCPHHPLHPGGRPGHGAQVSVSRADDLGRPGRAVPASPLTMHDSRQSHTPALPLSTGPLDPSPLSPRLKTIGRCEWHVQPSGPSR